MKFRLSPLYAVVPFAVMLASVAAAQITPQISPGAISNENERGQEQIEKTHPSPRTAPQQAPVTAPEAPERGKPSASTVRFVLTGVTFDPSKFLSVPELDEAARAYVGHTIDFNNLQVLIQKINALYKSKGQVTARAVLPPQKIKDGTVHIALIEGKFGKADVKGAVRTKEPFIRDRIAMPSGVTVDVRDLSRQVVFFNRTNDVQLRAMLRPGESFGETDVELDVTEPDPNLLQAFIDNKGVSSTGRVEGGVYYRRHDLLGVDDKFSLFGTVSRGGVDGTLSYNVPVGASGERLTASYERNHIDVVQGPFKELGITGNGQTGTIGFSHPLTATDRWLTLAILNQSVGTSTSKAAGGDLTDTITYRTAAGLSATYIGNGVLATIAPSLSFAHTHNSILAEEHGMALFTGSGSAIMRLGDDWSAHLATAWQFTPAKLLPSDLLFQIGGPTSVRGYQSGTFAGDSGYFANFELHRNLDLAKGLDLFAFFDTGSVFATSPSARSLHSLGAGGVLHVTESVGLSASIGVPLKTAIPGEKGYQLYLQLAAGL